MRLWPLLAVLVACGGGPQLTHLRCRVEPCQDPEDPLKVRLAVDFSDESGTLDQGQLELRVNGSTQQRLPLHDIFAAQAIPIGAKTGTLEIDQDMILDRIGQGQEVTSSLRATNGQGDGSNEPRMKFTLTLGTR